MRFQRESLEGAVSEILKLVPEHFKEVSHFQDQTIEPNFEVFKILELQGLLHIFTARDNENTLCGYAVFIVSPHFHYGKIKQASATLMFMRKESRGFGMNFIRFCDEQLKALGANLIQHSVTDNKDFSPVLKRLGYQKLETLYVRRI